jgi:hypothetical protein
LGVWTLSIALVLKNKLRKNTTFQKLDLFPSSGEGKTYSVGSLRKSCAIAQAVSCWLPTTLARVCVRAEHMGFVVDKAAQGQVFFKYFGFPCQSSFDLLLYHHNHPVLAQ